MSRIIENPRVTLLEIKNFKKIKTATIAPDGSVIRITGKNASGKSSSLDGIESLCRGKAVPGVPIREGEDSAEITVHLNGGELIVRRVFETGKNRTGQLTVTDKEIGVLPSPQKIIDGLIGSRNLDPFKFMRLKPPEQLMEIREIVGLDFSEEQKKKEDAYSARKKTNQEIKKYQGAIDSITLPADCPTEKISSKVLMEKIKDGRQVNVENEAHRKEYVEMKVRVVECEDNVGRLKKELEDFKQELKDTENYIVEKIVPKIDTLKDVDISVFEGRLESLDDHNALVQKFEEKEYKKGTLTRLQEDSKKYTKEIKDSDKAVVDKISKAKFPVDGLSIVEGEVIFNGVPLEQASQAEQWKVAVGMAMAGDPDLRVILIRDGSLLDTESLADIYAMAEEKDYQVFIEIVSDGGDDDNSIVFEDGEIK